MNFATREAAPWAPDWMPASGVQLRLCGSAFDAVRMVHGVGEDAAVALCGLTQYDPGPVIQEYTGRQTYFLLPPGTAQGRTWSTSVKVCASRAMDGTAYVGVPALWGGTWPLGWRCLPTLAHPYVSPDLLERVTRGVRA